MMFIKIRLWNFVEKGLMNLQHSLSSRPKRMKFILYDWTLLPILFAFRNWLSEVLTQNLMNFFHCSSQFFMEQFPYYLLTLFMVFCHPKFSSLGLRYLFKSSLIPIDWLGRIFDRRGRLSWIKAQYLKEFFQSLIPILGSTQEIFWHLFKLPL